MQKIGNKSILFGKNILIGVTGSISAYKVPELVRLIVKMGACVKVVLTKDATAFVSPLTLSTVSCNDVVLDFTDEKKIKWNNHVDLGLWADIFLIAPITANTISKMASGLCDNILLATYLSCQCPVFCAPAMDRDMYQNKIIQNNLSKLIQLGIFIIPPEKGELASGLNGVGRLSSFDIIISSIKDFLLKNMSLSGKKVLITAGPTYEKLDPVRYLGNFSSGKMGCALAYSAALRGASVDLVMGPSNEEIFHPLINRIDIQSAHDMYNKCQEKFAVSDIVIFAAAVSDYRPMKISNKKIKKAMLTIKSELNIDIAKTLSMKKKNQFTVGFALETDNEDNNAVNKLKEKKLDLIILNTINENHNYFGSNNNKVKLIDKGLNINEYPEMQKKDIADLIFNNILENSRFK